MIEALQQECADLPPAQLIERVLDRTGYLDWVEQQDNLEHTSRAENLRELSNAMAEAAEQGQTLEDILDHAALVERCRRIRRVRARLADDASQRQGPRIRRRLSRGPRRGLAAAQPLASIATRELEEERRLFYVGMTRAKRSLVLSRAHLSPHLRRRATARFASLAFLAEIPGEMIEAAAGSYSEPGETRRYEPDPEFSAGSTAQRRPTSPMATAILPPPRHDPSPTPAPRAARSSNPLIGARVRHSKYGVGTIIEIEGEGEDRKLTVSFRTTAPKNLWSATPTSNSPDRQSPVARNVRTR